MHVHNFQTTAINWIILFRVRYYVYVVYISGRGISKDKKKENRNIHEKMAVRILPGQLTK